MAGIKANLLQNVIMNHDQWHLYYTPINVADDILKYVPKSFRPKLVVDICAGRGNFLTSSTKALRKTKVKHYAFDINLHEDLLKNHNWTIMKVNSLKINKIKDLVPIDQKKLVIANPPFGNFYEDLILDKESKHLELITNEANRLNRIEAKMLISNIALMRKGDVFAAILPENIFTSERFSQFKNLFLKSFEVKYVSAPEKFFGRCEVVSRKFVGIFKGISQPALPNLKSSSQEVGGTLIYRGVDNSLLKTRDELKGTYSREVIHFNNKNGETLQQKRIECSRVRSRVKIERNDLLVIRVGRSAGLIIHEIDRLEGKLFSDHFLLVKNAGISGSQITTLQRNLTRRIRGLTTRYVTRSDISDSLSGLI